MTLTVGTESYLMVFTSVEAMVAQLSGVPAFRTTTCAELIEKWPDEQWLLAVDPGLPIQAYLPIDVLAEALAGDVFVVEVPTEDDLPFEPFNEVESDLVDAGDEVAVLSTLLLASVLVPVAEPTTAEPGDADFPWHVVNVDGPSVVAFTSAERMVELIPDGAPFVAVPFVDIVMGWPDPRWQLIVNPASVVEVTLPGAGMAAVLDLAAGIVSSEDPEAGSTNEGDGRAAALGRPTQG